MDMPQDPTPPDMVWLKIDDLLLCPESFEVRYKGRILELGATEFRLLHFLLRNLGRTYTRDRLLNNVWGQDVMVEERTVDVHVRRLRQELEKFGIQDIVQTIRGIGYRGIRLGVDDGHVSA